MHNFTPLSALGGGVLIGLAVSLLLLFNGKVAGVCGIFSGVVIPRAGDFTWRAAFLAGLVAGGLALVLLHPGSFPATVSRSPALIAAAGLLVGFGTRLGSGCTSGHGVCGLSRLSARSLVATLTFIALGVATVYIVNHVLGVA